MEHAFWLVRVPPKFRLLLPEKGFLRAGCVFMNVEERGGHWQSRGNSLITSFESGSWVLI